MLTLLVVPLLYTFLDDLRIYAKNLTRGAFAAPAVLTGEAAADAAGDSRLVPPSPPARSDLT